MTEKSKQALISDEIKAALAGGAKLTSAELAKRCPTAHDSTDIARVICNMRADGLVTMVGTKKSSISRSGTVRVWELAGTKPEESVEDEAIQVPCDGWHSGMQEPTTDEQRRWADLMSPDEQSIDPEMVLEDLVDHVDEAILTYADMMLANNATWVNLRRMQNDAFNVLCDYRLTKTLEQS